MKTTKSNIRFGGMLPILVLALGLVVCQAKLASAALFEDDFSGDLSKWNLWHHPSTIYNYNIEIINSDGNPPPCLLLDDKANWGTYATSKQTFSYINRSIEFSADIQQGNAGFPDQRFASLFLSKQNEYVAGDDHFARITITGSSHPNPTTQNTVTCKLLYEDSGAEIWEDSGPLPIPSGDGDGWHNAMVSIRDHGIVEFYLDAVLVYTSIHTITSAYDGQAAVAIGDRKSLYDNVLVAAVSGARNSLDAADGSPINAVYVDEEGNVGIGKTSPVAKLDVAGDIAVNSTLVINSLGQWVGDPTGLQGPPGEQGPKGDPGPQGPPGEQGPTLGIYDSLGLNSSGGRAAGDAGGRTLYNLGNVGLGTTSPAEKLEVSGNVKISGSGSGLIFPDGTKQITAGAGGGGGNIRIDYSSGIEIIQQNGYVSRIDPYRNDLRILNSATGDIKFLTGTLPNNTHPRLLIANDGNVGIGTTSPSEKLDVAGAVNLNKGISTGIALRVNGAEALWYDGDYFSWGFGGTGNFFADSVGIGQVDPGPHKLYVNGTGYATGGFWASDLRFKKNIKTIDSPIDKINNIRGVSFEWKRSEYQDKGLPEGEHYGVIAQEIEQVLPEIVKEGPNGDKAVSYTELVPILTEAIKEQQKQLEEQQRQVEYLLQRVESLERFVQQQQFALAKEVQQ